MAPRIESLSVQNLRSIGEDRVTIKFPSSGTLVLLGENNAGKSNITRALDILFGEYWPGNRKLEDHDFHGRDSDGIAVDVGATVSGMSCPYCRSGDVRHFRWTYDPQKPAPDGNPVTYRFACSNQHCSKTFVNGAMRSTLSAAVLDADRRLDYQLSYTSKYTMLSKMMHRFHERLLDAPTRKQQLADIFANILKEFDGVPEFASFKNCLQKQQTTLVRTCPIGSTLTSAPTTRATSSGHSGFIRRFPGKCEASTSSAPASLRSLHWPSPTPMQWRTANLRERSWLSTSRKQIYTHWPSNGLPLG